MNFHNKTGEIIVSLTYNSLADSNAGGALLSFIPVTDDKVNFTGSALISMNKETSRNYTLPFSLSPGGYRVFVYDIEHDGTLPSDVNYPAVTRDISNDDLPERYFEPRFVHIKNCTIKTLSLVIAARCEYPTNSIATGFQMIAQQSDLNKVRQLFVNKTEELDASASIEVKENGAYQVAIFAIQEGSGITESNVEYIKQVSISGEPPPSDWRLVLGLALGK